MPGVPLICTSIGVVTVCSTVWASAPVKPPVTCTIGGVIFGYWLIGKLYNDSSPTTRITIEITMAVFGLLINTSAIIKNWLFISLLTCPASGKVGGRARFFLGASGGNSIDHRCVTPLYFH